MATIPQNPYMTMGNYGMNAYQPMSPFELTQPQAMPNWQASALTPPAQISFPMASAGVGAGGFDPMTNGSGNGAWLGSFGDMAPSLASPGGGNGSTPFLSTRDQQGWGGMALQGASSLANLYMGMKQYGLAKDQLAFQKDSFNKQFEVNKNLTNSRLEDRQNRRVLENPNATSAAEYMSKWGVK